MKIFLIMICTLFFLQQAFAADQQKSPWSGNVEVGYSGSTGNTDEKDLSFNSKVIYSTQTWKHSLNGELSIYENSGVRFSEEIEFAYDAAYFLNEKQYIFNHASYEKDIAEDIDRRLVEAIGYGYIFIKEDQHNLTTELGVGKRETIYLNDEDGGLETIGYLGVFYDKKLTDNISIEEELVILGSSDNQVSKATTTLQLSINDNVSVGLEHQLTYTSNPSEENKKTDSTMDIMLKYSF